MITIPNELNGNPNPFNTFNTGYYQQGLIALLEGLGTDVDYWFEQPPAELKKLGSSFKDQIRE
jgi:hypothetical protein